MNRTENILNAVGFAADVMGIGFMFGDLLSSDDGIDEINGRLDGISAQLDTIEGLVRADIKGNLNEWHEISKNAIGDVRAAQNVGLSEAERVGLAQQANERAENALDGLIARIDSLGLGTGGPQASNFATFSIDDLVYMITIVGHAISVRQAVSHSLADGPLGDIGLQADIIDAYDFLFDRQNNTGLINDLEEKIRSETFVTFINPPSNTLARRMLDEADNSWYDLEANQLPEATYDVIWAPPGTGNFGVFFGPDYDPAEWLRTTTTVFREAGSTALSTPDNSDNLELGLNGTRYETDASFQVRINAGIAEARTLVVDEAMVSLGMYALIDSIENETVRLADSAEVVDDNHDIGLTAGDDDYTATMLADYVRGNDGDDRIEGLGGPDALVGGRGNDVLIGGNWTDALTGGPGSDMLFGATIGETNQTVDTANFDGNSRDYTIEGGRTYATVTHSDGTRDKLFDIDVVRFDDGFIELGEGNALDGAGDIEDFTIPEIVALLYAAALDRSNTDDDPNNNLDRGGLNFYIDAMEGGFGVVALAENLMTSPEFTQNFGDVDTLSNEAFVDRVYQNVLDRAPEQRGRDFYIAELSERGQTKAQVLADIAISPENASEAQATLMSLYETSTPEVRVLPNISIDLDWVFVS